MQSDAAPCSVVNLRGFRAPRGDLNGRYYTDYRRYCGNGPVFVQSRAVHATGQRVRYAMHAVHSDLPSVENLLTIFEMLPIKCSHGLTHAVASTRGHFTNITELNHTTFVPSFHAQRTIGRPAHLIVQCITEKATSEADDSTVIRIRG